MKGYTSSRALHLCALCRGPALQEAREHGALVLGTRFSAGPPGALLISDVKLPPPTHSRIFASESVLERCIGVTRFLKQLV